MRWIILVLALVEGGWLAFDGAHGLVTGDYVTPSSGEHAGQLGPWSQLVEAVGGHATGGEGMEKDYLREMRKDKKKAAEFKRQLLSHRIIYADPMDLTKILDKAPGTHVLDGVRVTQSLFYPGGASGFRVGGFGVI